MSSDRENTFQLSFFKEELTISGKNFLKISANFKTDEIWAKIP